MRLVFDMQVHYCYSRCTWTHWDMFIKSLSHRFTPKVVTHFTRLLICWQWGIGLGIFEGPASAYKQDDSLHEQVVSWLLVQECLSVSQSASTSSQLCWLNHTFVLSQLWGIFAQCPPLLLDLCPELPLANEQWASQLLQDRALWWIILLHWVGMWTA